MFAIGIGVLVLVWAAAGTVLRPGSADRVAEQPSPDGPRPPDDPVPPGRPGQAVDVTRLARQVARLRDLPLRRRLKTRVTSAQALGDKVSELAFDETDPDEVAETQRLLVALRLVPPGTDLLGVSENLYREQILGLYVPKERTLYVRRGDRGSPMRRVTTVHEITHALQDQSFNLVRMHRRVEDDAEAAAALLALVEGDAVLTQQLWAVQHLSSEQQRALGDSGTDNDALSDAPEYLRASLFFPYQQGGQFVAELFRGGGFDAVNDAFDDPPTTTEQIMHPEKYRDRDEATPIRVTAAPGGAWQRAATYPLGEFDLQQMFRVLGSATADAAAEGWGGGEIRSWHRRKKTTVAAALSFDSQSDADEACAALPRWYTAVADGRDVGDGTYRGDTDHLVVRCSGQRIRFGLAPTAKGAATAAGG